MSESGVKNAKACKYEKDNRRVDLNGGIEIFGWTLKLAWSESTTSENWCWGEIGLMMSARWELVFAEREGAGCQSGRMANAV